MHRGNCSILNASEIILIPGGVWVAVLFRVDLKYPMLLEELARNETQLIEGIQGMRLEEAWEALKGLESSSAGYK
ncbi:hypothetical protein Tco_0064626 [Tanacetum coccineum]